MTHKQYRKLLTILSALMYTIEACAIILMIYLGYRIIPLLWQD